MGSGFNNVIFEIPRTWEYLENAQKKKCSDVTDMETGIELIFMK
jgi:hypothetical protein